MIALLGALDLPLWLLHVWRALLWCAELSLIGSFLVFAPKAWRAHRRNDPIISDWTLWMYFGVGLALVQSAIIQLDRWDEPELWYELPVTTLIVVCWFKARWIRIHKLF